MFILLFQPQELVRPHSGKVVPFQALIEEIPIDRLRRLRTLAGRDGHLTIGRRDALPVPTAPCSDHRR